MNNKCDVQVLTMHDSYHHIDSHSIHHWSQYSFQLWHSKQGTCQSATSSFQKTRQLIIQYLRHFWTSEVTVYLTINGEIMRHQTDSQIQVTDMHIA